MVMVGDLRESTKEDFARAIPRTQRERILRGEIDPGRNIAALRRFTGLTLQQFATAFSISVHMARHPRVLRENLALPA